MACSRLFQIFDGRTGAAPLRPSGTFSRGRRGRKEAAEVVPLLPSGEDGPQGRMRGEAGVGLRIARQSLELRGVPRYSRYLESAIVLTENKGVFH